MRITTIVTALAVALPAMVARAQPLYNPAPTPDCDRVCLIDLVDAYLGALVEHDPDALPFSEGARFVENAEPTRIGAGLWRTASAVPMRFKIYVPDPVAGQVGFIGVMDEDGDPVELALRLRIEQGRITEVEHLIARKLRESNLENLQVPRSGLLGVVPLYERVSRAAMLEIGRAFYVASQASDGSAAPFGDDCALRENGMQTTSNPPPAPALPGQELGFGFFGSLGCAAQLDTRIMSYIDRIDERRVEIADVETGLVFGLAHFRHAMKSKHVKIVGVPGVETWEVDFEPFDRPAAHVFKISGGEIHEIEAVGFVLPYNSPTGWE